MFLLINRWWMYGDIVLSEEQAKGNVFMVLYDQIQQLKSFVILMFKMISLPKAGVRIRGWFPRRCVEKCHYDSASNSTSEEKKDQ